MRFRLLGIAFASALIAVQLLGGEVTAGRRKDTQPPTAPTLTTNAASATQIKLAWTLSTDNVAVKGYRIFRADLSTSLGTVGATVTTFTDDKLAPLRTYTYTVEAFDGAGNKAVSNASSSTTPADTSPPSIPTNVSARAVTSNVVSVSWSSSSDNVGVSGYTVYRSDLAQPLGNVSGSTTSFSDSTVSPETSYSYTVDAVDAAGNRSGQSSPASVTTPPTTSADPVIAAAGDIACDPDSDYYNGGLGTSGRCHMKATSDLVTQAAPTAVLALGDTQYEAGTLSTFQTSYDVWGWGPSRPLTYPAVGNHEWRTANAQGYYDYFRQGSLLPQSVSPGNYYYSYDIGAWHVIVLDSDCAFVPGGGCVAGSTQDQWLRQDLAAHPTKCTLAYWHHPLFTSSTGGGNPEVGPFWTALYGAGADVVLNGHAHNYQRFKLLTPSRTVDTANGIREFVVGSGGKSHYPFATNPSDRDAGNDDTYGILLMTLHADSYDWKFVPESGKTYTDSGSAACH